MKKNGKMLINVSKWEFPLSENQIRNLQNVTPVLLKTIREENKRLRDGNYVCMN